MSYATDDTIAAIATAPGAAGLAVVRVSGTRAMAIADAVFRGRHRLAQVPSHTLHHGWGVTEAAGERIDEIVAAVFRAPRSYTREDAVELSCHGGRLSAERLLAALIAAGARLAGPGEFSLRAFLNGRIDLAQAEAICDVIHADSEASHALALAQLAGDLSRRLTRLADDLADVLAEIEARVDFAEDVGGVEVPPHAITALEAGRDGLSTLLEGAAYARAVREGARIPIVGRPNAGKSSLFNALVGEERAIVSPLPGTTRDRVSESVDLHGIRVCFSDTAGIHDGSEPIEAIGIARTEALLDEAPVAVWVVDGAAPLDQRDARVAGRLRGKRVLVALNKSDAGTVVDRADLEPLIGEARARSAWSCVRVSARDGAGLPELRHGLLDVLGVPLEHTGARTGSAHGACAAPSLALANARHIDALSKAHAALERAVEAGRNGAPGEIVSIEIRDAMRAIGEVIGRDVDADLLDRIFSRFCIGK